jgi:crossover junction endodeoxyribonuclease RuvC
MSYVVMGVDPGFSVTGFSIVCSEGSRIRLYECGGFTMSRSLTLAQRIGLFHNFFHDKMQHYQVNVVALETPFLGKNAQNFLKLGYLRGMLYYLHNLHDTALCEFSPREVKQAITGYGAADKEQVARLVMRLFPELAVPRTHDVTDAIAISLCGLWRLPVRRLADG